MKKMIYSAACLALVIIIMAGCKESDSSPEFIPEGYYSGSYSYLGDTVFDAINFSLNTFQEVASGGIADQKFPCLVEGTYSIQNDKVEFVVLEYPSQGSNCDSGMLLSGTYNISIIGETIEFWKGEDPNKQSYKFEKVSSSR